MKAMVGDTGVLIPLRLLRGVREVEIRVEGRNVVVEPAELESDPVFRLGEDPVQSGLQDGAEHHDAHLHAAL